ncbi:WD40 repeat-like protein [Xylariaceae sp. FL0662B]|nr:WD40 repeat-like protein [Xylariaceae sp. FL0662B]
MSCKLAALGHLHREYVLNPITALAFYTSSTNGRQYLLAGEDTNLQVYDVHATRLCGRLCVFQAQSIHGIAVPPADKDASYPQPRQILIWGGHAVRVLPGLVTESLIAGHIDEARGWTRGAAEARAPDWIFDGRVSAFGDGRVVLLTAHNEVIQARVSADQSSLVFGRVHSPSRPILYSGNFFWVSRDCVLVAAGTVFGEIVVWKCYLEARGREQDCEILFVFSGHEGSIFGVHISPEIQTPTGETLRLLASCSDDRTIRVWDITERRKNRQDPIGDYGVRISDARQTGFGDSVEATSHDDSSARSVATVMGHASRIWQVGFPQEHTSFKQSKIIELYSFGEDATAQKWNLHLETHPAVSPATDALNITPVKPIARLTHQATYSNHSGKHIWSHTMVLIDGALVIATGGSDGKIALIDHSTKTFQQGTPGEQISIYNTSQPIVWSLADVTRSCRLGHDTVELKEKPDAVLEGPTSSPRSTKSKHLKETFHRYAFISDSRFLAATNSGRVFVGTFEDELRWQELFLPDNLHQTSFSHAVLGSSRKKGMAFIGTPSGEVYYYNQSKGTLLQLITRVDGKVADLFCLSDTIDEKGQNSTQGDRLELLVTIFGSTKAVIVQVNFNLSITKHIDVMLNRVFGVTAAAFSQDYLILGSRSGFITILGQNAEDRYSTVCTIRIKLNEALTSILPLPNRKNQSPNYILTTCRDGKYRIHEIVTTANRPDAVLLHETTPPFGPLIEGAWFSHNVDGTKDLMLCGFRSKNFVVWNESQRREVGTVDCGGSSRSYAWATRGDDPDAFRFVFTRTSHMHVFSQSRSPHKVLKPGGHGREIKAVSASEKYIATGAEDTTIRIWEYHDERSSHIAPSDRGLRCVAVLEKHATGIQALKWYKSEYLFSSGGNEEFFVWKINKLDNDIIGLAVVCEAVFPDLSEVGDLRIMDFDVECITERTVEFCISMALSNSTLQSYIYSRAAGFRLLGRTTYTGACLTQIRHLGFVDGRPHVLTAATDGHLAIFTDVAPPTTTESGGGSGVASPPPPTVAKLHQSTIKSLDICRLVNPSGGGTAYLIVTGGDDDALGIVHISSRLPPLPPSSAQAPNANAALSYTIVRRAIVRSAHGAAITGLAIARLENGGADARIVSTSNDQRVRVWRVGGWWAEEEQQLRVQLVDESYSAVADSGALEVLGAGRGGGDGDRALVAGVGVEIWRIGGQGASLVT